MEPRESRATASQRLLMRLFLWGLAGMLLLDGIVLLFFGTGHHLGWTLLLALETLLLILSIGQNGQLIARFQTPIQALEAASVALRKNDLDAETLRDLARRLDQVNVEHLGRRVTLPGQREELTVLTTAINSMLERIDRGYQAQSRFVSDASHELRTPISVIQGYANMLDRWGKNDPEAGQEAIDAIRQEAESMAQLVDQLLFLARGDNETQVVRPVLLNLSDMVEDVCAETKLLDTKRTITGEIAPMLMVEADAGLTKQVLRILTDNACKYTPEGGQIHIALKKQGTWAACSVTDTGQGIPAEDLPRVFDRFYRSDESRARQTGGSGLGLSIAKWVAVRQGGSIEVVSCPGVGSRFTLLLPLIDLAAEAEKLVQESLHGSPHPQGER